MDLLCKQDWSSEILSLSLSLIQVAQASLYLSQQENIKFLERSSKGNKEYTQAGSLGDFSPVSI